MKSILISLALLISISSFSQTKETETIKFKVYGNCEMCKKTIEGSLDTKGVKSANWNKETKIIEIVYLPAKINQDKLHELIASSGYDTELKKADDAAYNALPECCQYTRKK
ncbi:MAG: heavy-metal-associated domain-containing protein [Bacteroidota bacterium]|nr:heavy-metal-associated domain-containing protein [Bacteroidota bacterium]